MARHVGIGFESTWGTPVAATKFFEVVSETVQLERSFFEVKPVRSNSVTNVLELSSIVRGDITMTANYQEISPWLYLFYGSGDSSGGGPFTHLFPAAAGTTGRTGIDATVEIQRDSTAQTWRYAGCKVTALNFTGTATEPVQMTATVLGESEATGTAATASYLDNDIIMPAHVSFSFDDAATTVCPVAFNLNMAWPLDETVCMGSSQLSREPQESDVLTISGDVTVVFESGEMSGEYATFDGSTVNDMQVIMSDGTHSVTIDMNKTRLTQATPHITGRERLVATFAFISYFDAAGTESGLFTVVNDDTVDYDSI